MPSRTRSLDDSGHPTEPADDLGLTFGRSRSARHPVLECLRSQPRTSMRFLIHGLLTLIAQPAALDVRVWLRAG
jgi:hypothetical protein